MKLYKVIIVLISLLITGCASTNTDIKELQKPMAEMPTPMMLDNDLVWTAPGMLWNGAQYLRFNLNKKEKLLHRSAVYHALDQANLGEITSWYSKERQANGKVRVVHQYPVSDGYCRVYQSYIQLNGASRHMTNNACKRYLGKWQFLK
jgi:surface antigen